MMTPEQIKEHEAVLVEALQKTKSDLGIKYISKRLQLLRSDPVEFEKLLQHEGNIEMVK